MKGMELDIVDGKQPAQHCYKQILCSINFKQSILIRHPQLVPSMILLDGCPAVENATPSNSFQHSWLPSRLPFMFAATQRKKERGALRTEAMLQTWIHMLRLP